MTETMTTPIVETPAEVVQVKKNKGGRPKGDRHAPIGVRVTDEEMNIILEAEKSTGFSRTELIRNAIRNIKTVQRMPQTDREMLGQIRLVGGNLNQMALAVNTLKKMEKLNDETFNKLSVVLEQTRDLLQDFKTQVMKERLHDC